MKHKTTGTPKLLAAAIGLGLAVAASPASALITWNDGLTTFEDDDIDFLIDGENEGNQIGILDVGDTLIAIAEVNSSAGVDIAPEELTAVAVIRLAAFADLDGTGGANDMIFTPTGDFDSFAGTSLGGTLNTTAMVAMWLDGSPDLAIAQDTINAGNASCSTLAGCLTQATDGTLWEVDGIDGTDADDHWIALNAQTDTTIVDGSPTTQIFGSVNAGLSILFNGTGQALVLNAQACGLFCAPGGDGFVDFLGSGTINGGAEGNFASEWFATSDFQFGKVRAVPEPGTLALLATGLLGFAASLRRRRT